METNLCRAMGVLAILISMGVGPASQPSAKPMKKKVASIDGTVFPPVTAQYWWENKKLPQIGTLMGTALENLTAGSIISLHSDHDTANRAKATVNKFGIDARLYDWVITGVQGSTFTLVGLDGGRISRLCLIGAKTTEDWNRKIAALSNGGLREGNSFRVGQIHYDFRQSGSWVEQIPARTNMDGKVVSPARTEKHPAALHIEIDSFDWAMATLCTSKEAFEACSAGRVELGMTMTETYIAMRAYPLKRIKSETPGTEKWVWTRTENQAKSQRVYTSEYGSTVVTERDISQVIAARAEFENFKLVKFEWVVGE